MAGECRGLLPLRYRLRRRRFCCWTLVVFSLVVFGVLVYDHLVLAQLSGSGTRLLPSFFLQVLCKMDEVSVQVWSNLLRRLAAAWCGVLAQLCRSSFICRTAPGSANIEAPEPPLQEEAAEATRLTRQECHSERNPRRKILSW